MRDSKLENLWQGARELKNLRKINLSRSYHLKELPDLSNATNLEELNMSHCKSLVEIPSHLQKLKKLRMWDCINLQVTPPDLNLASLELIDMKRSKPEAQPFGPRLTFSTFDSLTQKKSSTSPPLVSAAVNLNSSFYYESSDVLQS